MKILIKNATIVGFNDFKSYKNADVIIENGIIKKIGKAEKDDFDKVIDATDLIVMPGLVNAHTHCGQTILRSYADDLPFDDWLFDRIFPIEEKLSKEIIYYSSLLGIAEMIQSGTTMFFDMYFHEEMTAKAVSESKIKAVLSRGLQSIGNSEQRIQEALDLISHYSSDKIRIFFGPHSIYTCDRNMLEKVCDLAKQFNTGIIIHVSESEQEIEYSYENFDASPVQYLNEIGIFNIPTVAAHCVYLEEEDFDILRENNVTVVYNPSSNLKLGNGFAPIYQLIQVDINVALGTDSAASNNNLNMLEEMHIASLLEKGIYKMSNIMKANEILKMATINGANASLFENTGSLEEGKKADMVLLKKNVPNMLPCFNPISNIVYSANPSDIYAVICDGEILYIDGKFNTIDIDSLVKEIKKINEYLIQNS